MNKLRDPSQAHLPAPPPMNTPPFDVTFCADLYPIETTANGLVFVLSAWSTLIKCNLFNPAKLL